ncbi:MAG: efflux transporter outer membrane subunit [Woeseiaceae bacterium]|nr:efflux transporter outer membrane subunit [Woeseiaceae bacterium]
MLTTMKKVGAEILLLTVALPGWLAGCTLTPAADVPEVVKRIGSEESFDSAAAAEADDVAGWWRRIGGDELDTMVASLRKDSPVLKEARSQALQATERAIQAGAPRTPSIGYSVETLRSRSPDFSGAFSWTESYSAGFNAGFETDVFGGLRANERAAKLASIAAELSYQATEQLEIARLSRNWVSATTLRSHLALAATTAESLRDTYELTAARFRAGSRNTTASDVLIARQNLDSALVDIPELQIQLRKQLLVIDEQLARSPGDSQRQIVSTNLPDPRATAPVGNPASLLTNRPDVAAAELRYRAALEDVGAARASLFPAISLTAAVTLQGESPGDFSWGDYIGSLSQSLTGPLFQGGRLRSQVRLEQAEADELATAYARTALAAITDAEIALTELAGLRDQLARAKTAVETSRKSNDLARNRYRQGLSSILVVLETQRSLDNAQLALILIKQALLNAEIDLFLSMGGDWTGIESEASAGDSL